MCWLQSWTVKLDLANVFASIVVDTLHSTFDHKQEKGKNPICTKKNDEIFIFPRCVKMAQHKSCMEREVKHFELMVIEIFSN